MELQTLQEALKVEIQVHQKLVAQMKQDPQNADLKKQLHELQAKITALSEKQKRVVEQLRKNLIVKQEQPDKFQIQPLSQSENKLQTAQQQPLQPLQQQQPQQPQQQQQQQQHAQQSAAAPPSLTASQTVTTASMITTKTLPLVLKAATATMPASVVGQRPTIAMVTAINSQKAVLSTDVQNTPVNLQTSSKVTGPGAEAVQIVAKKTQSLCRFKQHLLSPSKYHSLSLLLDSLHAQTSFHRFDPSLWPRITFLSLQRLLPCLQLLSLSRGLSC